MMYLAMMYLIFYLILLYMMGEETLSCASSSISACMVGCLALKRAHVCMSESIAESDKSVWKQYSYTHTIN